MATTNPTITTSWAKIVDAGDDSTLGLPHGPQVQIAIACMTADEAPAIAGQPLQSSSEAVNRFDPHVEIDSLCSKSEYVK